MSNKTRLQVNNADLEALITAADSLPEIQIEQEKTVTAGTTVTEVTPDEKHVLTKVTVNPTPTQSKNVNPLDTEQTVLPDDGMHLSSVVVGAIPLEEKTVTAGTVAVEVNPTAGKYMNKVTVNPTPSETKNVTATTGVTTVTPNAGNLLSSVTVNPTPSTSKTVTPGVNNITVNPDSGKLLSSVIVNGDSDLISSNIKKGVNIFGVDGSMEEGMAAETGTFTGAGWMTQKEVPTELTNISDYVLILESGTLDYKGAYTGLKYDASIFGIETRECDTGGTSYQTVANISINDKIATITLNKITSTSIPVFWDGCVYRYWFLQRI